MLLRLLLVAVLTCALLPYSSMAIKPRKVHVHLEGNRRRCFMEEMTAGTVLMSTYLLYILLYINTPTIIR